MQKIQSVHSIMLQGKEVTYILTRKKVKNINVRIKPDGSIHVSAGRWVSLSSIENFMILKGANILRALDKYEDCRRKAEALRQQYEGKQPDRNQVRLLLYGICEEIYPLFRPYGVTYPVIKIRKMTSRWGSCQPLKGIITLNSKLAQVPRECAEYVVVHEFAHFLQPNHSKDFYGVVAGIMPDYKERKKKLEQFRFL